MNEELRSAAEELETSKEELQSVNEELTTVNQELKIKIEELGAHQQRLPEPDQLHRHRHDLPRPRAAGEAVDARAPRRLQPAPTDVGRPLSDITSRLQYDDLHDDVQRGARAAAARSSARCETRDGRWYLMRILPVPDHRRPHRRRRDHVPGHHRPAQRRGRICAERRAAAPADRQRARLRDLHDDERRHRRFVEPRRRADVRLRRRRDHRQQRRRCCSRRRIAPPDVPAQELAAGATDGRAADERWHLRKDGTRFYCSGVTPRLGEARLGLREDRARPDRAAGRRPTRCEDAHAELENACSERTGELEARGRSTRATSSIASPCCCSAWSPRRRTNARASPATCTTTSASSSPRCA